MSCYLLKYSLIKMIYWMCDKSGCPPTWPQLEHAIRRNFGGLDEATLNPLDEFKRNLPCNKEPLDVTQMPPEVGGSLVKIGGYIPGVSPKPEVGTVPPP